MSNGEPTTSTTTTTTSTSTTSATTPAPALSPPYPPDPTPIGPTPVDPIPTGPPLGEVCVACGCRSVGPCDLCGGATGTATLSPCPRCPNGERIA